jgi:thiamine biosynthesis lipoprotein
MLLAAMTLALAPSRFEFTQSHMGVAVRVTLYAPGRATAETAAKAAFAKFAELDAMMSDYQKGSEINRLVEEATGRPVRVSADLFEALLAAKRVAVLSEGAFDFTSGPLVRLWRESRRTGSLPDPAKLQEAKSRVGWRRILLDPATKSVEIVGHGTAIDLGGIAKGYACDQALAALRRQGVGRAMIQAGGDITVSGPPPERPGWTIALQGCPDGPLVLAHQAVSTSGDSHQYIEIEGTRYSHIVDPRTGLGLTNRIQATVVARRGVDADPLATALCVLGPGPGDELAAKFGARAVWARPGQDGK